jgi:hypothetical protein
MSRMNFLSLAALGALLVSSGCILGSARPVQRTQTGGVIALEGDRQKAMEEASQHMAAHCQGPYTIVEEGEHVVGSETRGGSDTYVAHDGTLVEDHGQSTRQATEWRIRYVCGGGTAPPPGAEGEYPPGAEGEEYPPGPPEGEYDEGGYDDDGYEGQP